MSLCITRTGGSGGGGKVGHATLPPYKKHSLASTVRLASLTTFCPSNSCLIFWAQNINEYGWSGGSAPAPILHNSLLDLGVASRWNGDGKGRKEGVGRGDREEGNGRKRGGLEKGIIKRKGEEKIESERRGVSFFLSLLGLPVSS